MARRSPPPPRRRRRRRRLPPGGARHRRRGCAVRGGAQEGEAVPPGPGVERLAVTLDLYNQGSATAYDVSLNDDSWPQEAFELVSGSTSKMVEKLDPGSTASHNFVLETKEQGKFQGSPAVIKYHVPTKAALQEAYSSSVLPFDILAERPPQQKFELAKRILGKYGPMASVVSFVGVFIYLVASPSKSGAAKGGKKRR